MGFHNINAMIYGFRFCTGDLGLLALGAGEEPHSLSVCPLLPLTYLWTEMVFFTKVDWHDTFLACLGSGSWSMPPQKWAREHDFLFIRNLISSVIYDVPSPTGCKSTIDASGDVSDFLILIYLTTRILSQRQEPCIKYTTAASIIVWRNYFKIISSPPPH